jgi:hypothetical protein
LAGRKQTLQAEGAAPLVSDQGLRLLFLWVRQGEWMNQQLELKTAKTATDFARRRCARFTVPGAVMDFEVLGLWRSRGFSGEKYPVEDLGRGGLSFLIDRPVKVNSRISVLLTLADDAPPVQLTGRVVYYIRRGTGPHYRVGVEFAPYADKKGFNPLSALRLFERLEDKYSE